LAHVLAPLVPADVHKRIYHEPFLGAGSLFFALSHPNARLSDLNKHLVECYTAIRDHPDAISKALRRHAREDSEDHYYAVRELYNRSPAGLARAARFLYLNRTCFNGVFRVNREGEFNVPYGHKESPRFPSSMDLHHVSKTLKTAHLEVQDYQTALQQADTGDFVYLDPPYPPLNGTSYFTHYTADRFSLADQAQVAHSVQDLHSRGCLFMLSNADTGAIRRLYQGFGIHKLSVTRFVSASRKKHRVRELVITNYPVPERK